MDTTIDTLAIEIETEAGKSLTNIDTLISKLDKLYDSLTRITTHYGKLQNIMKDINKINVKQTVTPKKTLSKSINAETIDTGSTQSIAGDNIKTSKEKIVDVDDKKIEDAKEETKELKQEAKEAKTAFDKLSSTINKTKSGAKSISKITSILSGTKNSVRKVEDAFKKSFAKSITGSIKKFGLAMIGVRSLFTALRASVQEYLQYYTQLEDSLRNNWAVLGSLLAPILERVIRLFGIAVAYIRAFVKALTGIDLVARANKKSIDSVGNSAKKALGNLAKFDELNVVEFPTKDGGGSSIPPLTTPEINTEKLDWFIKYIKDGNWYGLGMEIGRLFNEGLRTINFDWFIDVATQWATNIADLFNGLTDGVDWSLVGEKVAGGLNTIITFVNTFFDNYNWDNLGSAVAEGLIGIVNNVDWAGLGQFFANKWVALIDFAYAFIQDFDWKGLGNGLGKGINTFISSIDWRKASKTIVDGFFGLLDLLGSTLATMDWKSVGTAISDFFVEGLKELNNKLAEIDWYQLGVDIWDGLVALISGIDWNGLVDEMARLFGLAITGLGVLLAGFCEDAINAIGEYFAQFIDENADWRENGANIILGVLEGIKDGLVNIGTWINEHILTPFLKGFKEAFKIASPSKVMKEQGRFVLNGFLDAFTNIKTLVKDIFNKAKIAVSEKITEIIDNIKTTFSKKNMEETFNTVKNAITNKFTEIKNNITMKMNEALSAVKNTFSLSNVTSHFQKIFNKIKSIFKNIGITVGNAVGSSFANVVNTVIGFVEKTINKFIKSINKAIGVINEIPGVKIKELDTINIPDIKLATGTNRIESEGLYHLHKNEAVVPEKYNPAVNDDLYNNKGVIEALGMVYRAINNLDLTNIVNIGNKTLYKETIKYSKTQNDVYGENVMSV